MDAASKERPMVSVIVCTMGRPEALARCLAGVCQGAGEPFEILVIDQSRDSLTARRVKEEFGARGNVSYIHSEKVGLSHARNLGAATAHGEILLYVDDDAVPGPGWLEAYRSAFVEILPVPGMMTGKTLPVYETERPPWYPLSREYLLGVYDLGDQRRPLPENHLPVGANFGVWSHLVSALGGFDDRLGFNESRGKGQVAGEDSLLGLKVLGAGHSLWYEPRAVVSHHIGARKLSRAYFLKRHYWEGITHITLQECLVRDSEDWLRAVFRWHVKNILRIVLLSGKAGLRAGDPAGRMEDLAGMAMSLGICRKTFGLLMRQGSGHERSP